MTPDPVVLRHDDPIAVAIHKMAVGGFRHIPIVEDGRPTGVVTARDVFHHLARRRSMRRREPAARRRPRPGPHLGGPPGPCRRGGRRRAGARRDRAGARPGARRRRLRDRRPDRAGLRRRRRDRAARASAARRCWRVGQHDDVELRKQALAAGATEVLAYRKLFEDGPAHGRGAGSAIAVAATAMTGARRPTGDPGARATRSAWLEPRELGRARGPRRAARRGRAGPAAT